MPSNSFVFPASGTGFARSAALTSFTSPVSGTTGAPPFYVSSTNTIVGSNIGATINAPAGLELGDLMMVLLIASSVDFAGGNPLIGPNGGWTIYPCQGTVGDTQIWWKIATPADVALSTFTFPTNSSYIFCSMSLWRGCNPQSPVSLMSFAQGASGTAFQSPAASGLPNNSTVLIFGNQDDSYIGGFSINQISDYPSAPFTLGFNINGNGYGAGGPPYSASAAMVYQEGVTSVAAQTFTQTNNGSTNAWVATVLALSPSDLQTCFAMATYEADLLDPEGIWTYNGITMSSVSSASGRYIDASTDGVSGFYALNSLGSLVHVPSLTASPVVIPLSTSPSFAYTGITYNSPDGHPYFIGYDGTIYKYNGTSVSTVVGPPGGVTAPARWLYSDGHSNFWTSFPGSNSVAEYSSSGAAWHIYTSPFNVALDTIFYSSSAGALIAGGRNNTSITPGGTIQDIVYSTGTNQLLVAFNSSTVNAYNLTDGGWVFAQAVNGYSGTPAQIAVEGDGLQAIVTDTTNNRLEILTYNNTWSETSTVALTGPSAIAMYTSGLSQALVCQPSQNQISILNKSLLNWSVVQTIPGITNPTGVAVTVSPGHLPTAIVSTSTGVNLFGFNGAVWQNNGAITLNPVPTMVATDSFADPNTYLYAAGSSGGITTVYIFNSTSLLGSYTLTGTALGLEVINYQALVTTSSGTLNAGYYVQGITGNAVNTASIPTGAFSMTWVPQDPVYFPLLVMAGTSQIWTFYDNSPQTIIRTTDSFVSILSGSGFKSAASIQYGFMPLGSRSGIASGGWSSIDLIDRNKISSIVTDNNSNIYAVTVENDIYKFNSSGVLVSGYPFTIIPPQGQEEDVPLGLSKAVALATNQIYIASAMMGGLTILTP